MLEALARVFRGKGFAHDFNSADQPIGNHSRFFHRVASHISFTRPDRSLGRDGHHCISIRRVISFASQGRIASGF
jgi:hypothetical protein